MSGIDTVHACPVCHLRFGLLAEVGAHIDDEHPVADTSALAAVAPTGRVSVPIDPDLPAPLAVAVGAQIAAQTGCSLELIAAPGFGLSFGAKAVLRARATELRQQGSSAVTWHLLEKKSPARAVLEYLESDAPDLVCMNTRALHGPSQLLFGSVAHGVLRDAVVPVLLVGPKVPDAPSHVRHVIACVDGSEHSAVALAVADRLRRAMNAELVLVEVIEPDGSASTDTYEGAELIHLAHSVGTPPASFDVLHGSNAAKAIVSYTDDISDAIVVTGTHGRTGLASALLGSVAHDVVAHSKHPTLVVPQSTDVNVFLRPSPSPAD